MVLVGYLSRQWITMFRLQARVPSWERYNELASTVCREKVRRGRWLTSPHAVWCIWPGARSVVWRWLASCYSVHNAPRGAVAFVDGDYEVNKER
jgi:hypothetical protein